MGRRLNIVLRGALNLELFDYKDIDSLWIVVESFYITMAGYYMPTKLLIYGGCICEKVVGQDYEVLYKRRSYRLDTCLINKKQQTYTYEDVMSYQI